MNTLDTPVEPSNRFDDFFVDPIYLRFKKSFWNYQIRLWLVRKILKQISAGKTLEVGAGIAPMVPESPSVIYTDISEHAVGYLKRAFPTADACVARAETLAFPDGYFDCVVSS